MSGESGVPRSHSHCGERQSPCRRYALRSSSRNRLARHLYARVPPRLFRRRRCMTSSRGRHCATSRLRNSRCHLCRCAARGFQGCLRRPWMSGRPASRPYRSSPPRAPRQRATTATTAAMIATREIVAILPGLSACRVAALRVDAERILEGSKLDAPLASRSRSPPWQRRLARQPAPPTRSWRRGVHRLALGMADRLDDPVRKAPNQFSPSGWRRFEQQVGCCEVPPDEIGHRSTTPCLDDRPRPEAISLHASTLRIFARSTRSVRIASRSARRALGTREGVDGRPSGSGSTAIGAKGSHLSHAFRHDLTRDDVSVVSPPSDVSRSSRRPFSSMRDRIDAAGCERMPSVNVRSIPTRARGSGFEARPRWLLGLVRHYSGARHDAREVSTLDAPVRHLVRRSRRH